MTNWFSNASLTPHGFCLLWEPSLIWSFIVGDAGTALSYFVLPVAIARFAQRRTDLVFKPVFWLFAAFILLCGTSHWLDLLTIWVPAYSLQADTKLATAAVSLVTAIATWRLLPAALALPSPRQMQRANERLLAREEELRRVNASLEAKVAERTAHLAANEARLQNLLATLDIGTFMTRHRDGTIQFWSEGCTRLYGWTAAEAIGRNAHELLRTSFPVPVADIEAALEREGVWTGDLTHTAKDGRVVTVEARKLLRREAADQAGEVLEALTDVTASRRAEREQRRTDTLLRGIVAAAPGLIYAKDRQGRFVLANPQLQTVFDRSWADIAGRTDLDLFDSRPQAEAVMATDLRIMEHGCTEELEELVGTEGGRPRVWLSTKTPLRTSDGVVEGLVGVSIEITERKRSEERLRLMVHELNHRVKNTLATVMAVASQTMRGADRDTVDALLSRLQSLATTHDVLTRESWESADLRDVVASALAAHGGPDDDRFEISGPPARLLPREAVALAMALHELATNALKYGALSTQAPEGRVELRWTVIRGRLHLVWAERGGPPVAVPTRRGFGTRLIERSLSQDLEAAITLEFRHDGVVCTVDATLGAAEMRRDTTPMLLNVGSP